MSDKQIPQELQDVIQSDSYLSDTLGIVDSLQEDEAPVAELEEKLEQAVDKSEESAIITDSESPAEEKSEIDLFMESLPTEAERKAAKLALEDNWSLDKYNEGGYGYREYNARKPLIEALKQQNDKINKLSSVIAKTRKTDVSYTKKQAEKALKTAEERFAQARDNNDYKAAEEAFTDIQAVKSIMSDVEADEQALTTLEEPTAPAMSDDYKQRLQTAAQSYLNEYKAFFSDEKGGLDQGKVESARLVEQEILTRNPNIDPELLYTKVQLQLERKGKVETKPEVKTESIQRPSVEDVSKVKGNGSGRKSISAADRELLDVLSELRSGKDGALYASEKEYMKIRGLA